MKKEGDREIGRGRERERQRGRDRQSFHGNKSNMPPGSTLMDKEIHTMFASYADTHTL